MSSNYGYDPNGWEREPFPGRDEHAKPARRPCLECAAGKGTTAPGPPHCPNHDRHCSSAPCW